LLWEQEAIGSTPVIPTKPLTKRNDTSLQSSKKVREGGGRA
jgi:hypothetical protein